MGRRSLMAFTSVSRMAFATSFLSPTMMNSGCCQVFCRPIVNVHGGLSPSSNMLTPNRIEQRRRAPCAHYHRCRCGWSPSDRAAVRSGLVERLDAGEVRAGWKQQDAGVAHVEFGFGIDHQNALQGIEEEMSEFPRQFVAVAELIGELRPGNHAGFVQVKQAMHQPGVDVEVHWTLAQLFDGRSREWRGALQNAMKQDT